MTRQAPPETPMSDSDSLSELETAVDAFVAERLRAARLRAMERQGAILAERDRADRMAIYERQNVSLREEISRMQAGRNSVLL